MFNPRLLPLLLFFVVAGTSAQDGGAARAKIKEKELEEVRERISELKQSMDESASDRDRLTTELQAAEVRIAEKRQHLRELERQLAYSTKRRNGLEADIAEREADLDSEATELGSQVRAAYMSGNQEKLKLLLNQRDPATLGRMMTYYGYLNNHRSGNIRTIGSRIRELAELRGQVAAEEARLSDLTGQQSRELASVEKAQQDRRELLASLQNKLASEGREIERLAAQEKDLARLIAELTSILSDYPISAEEPFEEYRGRLTWPVAGTLIHDFGQPRVGGQLKWNGVVLATDRGREVRAVYHGRVAFADWLAGMGLLVIVDHGDGYMTLYGYNETILKRTGDWVAPGDVLATVGDSGGQARPGLYFEIRNGTKPLNPRRWVTRRPGD
jgi:septal ring factor EnvC (AmiA/AmiB activator)